MKEERIEKWAEDYLMAHGIKKMTEEYFTQDSFTVPEESLKEALPSILDGLYDFLTDTPQATGAMKSRIEGKEGDALISSLLYIWCHAFIPVTLTWEKNPAFSRKILVPLRFNLSDILYAGLSTLRTSLHEAVYLESEEYAFITPMEGDADDVKSFMADNYASYAIYSLRNPYLSYGYREAWSFAITLGYMRILDDKKSREPLLVMDAKGYGILEDMMDVLNEYLFNPYAKRNGVLLEDMIGLNFADADLEGLQSGKDEAFYMTQYRYEAGIKE